MDIQTKKEKAKELLTITGRISCITESEEPDMDTIVQLIDMRQEIIFELEKCGQDPADEEITELFRQIYIEDIKNTTRMEQIMESYTNNIRKINTTKKQISYFPKSDYSEGLFIDKRE